MLIQMPIKTPHPKQVPLVYGTSKRLIVCAGRRAGKTAGLSIKAARRFAEGRRVLYAAPTQEQTARFWQEVQMTLEPAIKSGALRLNRSTRLIENRANPVNAIRAKTAWNADTLRGDYADELILDEWQLMNEDAWEQVGAPMLMDNDGNATFLFTPPSIFSRTVSKAQDKRHAIKMFKAAEHLEGWERLHFTSYDNPHISRDGLAAAKRDMLDIKYRMEIMAEMLEDAPNALWQRALFGSDRYRPAPELTRVVVGVDPSGSQRGDEVGIVVVGKDRQNRLFVLEDATMSNATPLQWASGVVGAYKKHKADLIVAETNFGGDMVKATLDQVNRGLPYKAVSASRGKVIRAQPIAALYAQPDKVYHTQAFGELEDQLCMWTPDSQWSPDRMDALVWACTELVEGIDREWGFF